MQGVTQINDFVLIVENKSQIARCFFIHPTQQCANTHKPI